jgi:GYF domain 2
MEDDEPHEIWFYSRDGEKHGPVSFTSLQAKAKDASLNPRLDMVWTKGMDEWKLAGDIEGLFKRRQILEPPEIPTPGAAAGPYQPPQEEPVAGQPGTEGTWPGARRRSYLFMTIIFPVLFSEGFSYGPPFLAPHLSPEMINYVTIGCMFVPAILALCFSLMRLVNLGMSRWWFLGNFVPFLNLWIGYRCFACPAGYAYHKKLDGAGIFLAIVYWLLWLIFLVAIIAIIAALFGSLGTPEMQQQIRDAIRTATAPKP